MQSNGKGFRKRGGLHHQLMSRALIDLAAAAGRKGGGDQKSRRILLSNRCRVDAEKYFVERLIR